MDFALDMGGFFLSAVMILALIAFVYAIADVIWDRLIAKGWDGLAVGVITIAGVIAALYWFVWRD